MKSHTEPHGTHSAALTLGQLRAGVSQSASSRLVSLVREGFQVGAIDELAAALEVTQARVLALAHMSRATLKRRRQAAEQRLSPEESDRVYRLAKVLERAVQLFGGDEAAARQWLKTPARALGGAVPLDQLDTEAGADQVLNLIGRLEHGVFT